VKVLDCLDTCVSMYKSKGAEIGGPGNGHGNGNGTHRDLMDDVELIDRILKEMRGIVDDPNNNVTSSMIRHVCF